MAQPQQRKIWVAGNWKMNQSREEIRRFFESLKQNWTPTEKVAVALFPTALGIAQAQESSKGMGIQIGTQNAHWEKSGAYTGELSGPLLKEAGVNLCLVGHSERRQYFGETNQTVHLRTKSLLSQGLHVMACIGETRPERESGNTNNILQAQLEALLMAGDDSFRTQACERLVIAYEPVWAIGTGLTATPAQAEETHLWIRNWLTKSLGPSSESISILYGGSIKTESFGELLNCPSVDGGLIGGASLKASDFGSLVRTAISLA